MELREGGHEDVRESEKVLWKNSNFGCDICLKFLVIKGRRKNINQKERKNKFNSK